MFKRFLSFFFSVFFKEISFVGTSLRFMSKQLLSPEIPEHPHPGAEGLGRPQCRSRSAANQRAVSLRMCLCFTHREQVLASDKKRTCFANNQCDLKPRVKAEVSICSLQHEPGSAMLVKWSALKKRTASQFPPFTQRTWEGRGKGGLTPHPQARLFHFVLLHRRARSREHL